jgi:hypothetical protein
VFPSWLSAGGSAFPASATSRSLNRTRELAWRSHVAYTFNPVVIAFFRRARKVRPAQIWERPMEGVLCLPGDLTDRRAGDIASDCYAVDRESMVVADKGVVVLIQLSIDVNPVSVRHLVDDVLSREQRSVRRDFVV